MLGLRLHQLLGGEEAEVQLEGGGEAPHHRDGVLEAELLQLGRAGVLLVLQIDAGCRRQQLFFG